MTAKRFGSLCPAFFNYLRKTWAYLAIWSLAFEAADSETLRMTLSSSTTPEQAVAYISELIESMPAFEVHVGTLTTEENRWLGKAHAILDDMAGPLICAEFRMAQTYLYTFNHDRNALLTPLYKALSAAELKLPAAKQGAYIPPGDKWNGYSAIVKLLAERKEPALIVDPYLDGTFVTDFLPLATKMEAVRGLTSDRYKASLEAASERWMSDRKPEQPIDIRMADRKLLHDRLILFNAEEVYLVSQSLKDIGAKSPASIQKASPEIAKEKLEHFAAVWKEAEVLVSWQP